MRIGTRACSACVQFPGWYLKAEKALNLRAQGLEWQEVAEQLGYAGMSTAEHAVKRAIARSLLAVERSGAR